MTIEEERVVDFMGVSRSTGGRTLTISDHLEWTDFEYHSTSLQSKINYYLEYIYSNTLHETASESNESKIRIQLIMKHEPTARASKLLRKIEAEIDSLGFEFIYSVFNG